MEFKTDIFHSGLSSTTELLLNRKLIKFKLGKVISGNYDACGSFSVFRFDKMLWLGTVTDLIILNVYV